jgi:hypothetical protein
LKFAAKRKILSDLRHSVPRKYQALQVSTTPPHRFKPHSWSFFAAVPNWPIW